MSQIDTKQGSYRVVLFPSHQLQPGGRKLIKIDLLEIAVLNVEGTLYAFRNECPHQGISMIYGPITGTMVTSNPQEYQYGLDNQLIKCPLHGWEFDLKTGKSVFLPDKVSLLTYDVRREEENIVIYLKREPKSVGVQDFSCAHI